MNPQGLEEFGATAAPPLAHGSNGPAPAPLQAAVRTLARRGGPGHRDGPLARTRRARHLHLGQTRLVMVPNGVDLDAAARVGGRRPGGRALGAGPAVDGLTPEQ